MAYCFNTGDETDLVQYGDSEDGLLQCPDCGDIMREDNLEVVNNK